MLSIKNTITAAQELADYFNWAVFPVNPKPKHHTSEAGKKLPALTQMRLKIFFLVCNMLQLACVLVKLPALFALI